MQVKTHKGASDPMIRKIPSFFTRVQPTRTSLPVELHEEMEGEVQENVMSDMELDPHDWLKMEITESYK